MSSPSPERPTETPSKTFARQLKLARRQAGLTQEALAERIKELGGGLHATAITRIERGDRAVTLDELALIARALTVSPLYLMFPIDDNTDVRLAPADKTHEPFRVRMWSRGEAPLLIDQAKQYGTVSTPPDYSFNRAYHTWQPGFETQLESNPAWSSTRSLLTAIATVVGMRLTRKRPDMPTVGPRGFELRILREAFRRTTFDVEPFIEEEMARGDS